MVGGGPRKPIGRYWPISQPFMARYSKFLCLVKACENPHWFLFHKRLPSVHRLAARGRWSDKGQSRQFFSAKNPKFSIFARNTWYTSNESWDYVEFKFTTKKYDLIEKNDKKFHFSHFCLENEADNFFSRANFSIFYIKMASPGAGRSFNLKSHQRRSLLIWNRQEISWAMGHHGPPRPV